VTVRHLTQKYSMRKERNGDPGSSEGARVAQPIANGLRSTSVGSPNSFPQVRAAPIGIAKFDAPHVTDRNSARPATAGPDSFYGNAPRRPIATSTRGSPGITRESAGAPVPGNPRIEPPYHSTSRKNNRSHHRFSSAQSSGENAPTASLPHKIGDSPYFLDSRFGVLYATGKLPCALLQSASEARATKLARFVLKRTHWCGPRLDDSCIVRSAPARGAPMRAH
jgi:hypothetical protein